MNSFEIGKIKSVALKDFITYDCLKYYPGDYLNVIIGANGTGKSSIVAGIILGCGGSQKLLSRSKDISEYIKNGKHKAHIEIEIASDENDGVVTFHRAFERKSKEFFSIDGVTVTHKEYLRKIKEFNIQVDNLCQFLPQDRVQDFTKLNPQELLLNTQTSVCSLEVINAFQTLVTKREEQKSSSKRNQDITSRLKDIESRNEQLRMIINNNKAKDNLIEKADICVKKKCWMEYDQYYKQLKEIESDLLKFNDLLKKRNADIKPLKKKSSDLEIIKKNIKMNISNALTQISETSLELDKIQDEGEKIENDINKAMQEMKNIIASVKDHANELKECIEILSFENQDLIKAKNNLGHENVEENSKQLNIVMQEIKVNIEKLLNRRNAISNVLDEQINPGIYAVERRINNIANIKNQRVEKLKSKFEDTYKAYVWLQDNRDQFEGHIYDPIIIEVNIKNKNDAKYIENTIAIKDLISFTCTTKQDMAKLIKKLRNEMGLAVNVAFVEDSNEIEFMPDYTIKDLEQYGFYSYLLDMIDGPIPILNFLCRLYGIHNIAVGDDTTYEIADRIPSHISKFFSTNHRFTVNISRYSKAKSSSCNVISDKNILNITLDKRELEKEEQTLAKLKRECDQKKNNRNAIEFEIKAHEIKLSEHKIDLKTLQDKVVLVRKCNEKVRKREIELVRIQSRNINVDEENVKFKIKIDQFVEKLLKNNDKKLMVLLQYKERFLSKLYNQKKLEMFNSSNGSLEEEIRAAQEDIERLIQTQNKIQSSLEQIKMKCRNKQIDAKKLTDNISPNHADFAYTVLFQKLPDCLEKLQIQIDELQGRIDCMGSGVDGSVYKDYEMQQKEIETLNAQILNGQSSSIQLEADIATMHQVWYPEIMNVVDTINKKFGNFMNKMGFVGEVEIVRNNERDYNEYGIQIRVQYRDNEKLQVLNRHVQSGGERAVAIAVYTLSLQHITNVPFRCVDEINQGMDPKNERKIFQMLVDITCHQGQSQYFFITPKLLPDLPYDDLMTITVVHNGKHIEDTYVFLDD
ncbi:unnamed protein product [Diamesa serratosioi]